MNDSEKLQNNLQKFKDTLKTLEGYSPVWVKHNTYIDAALHPTRWAERPFDMDTINFAWWVWLRAHPEKPRVPDRTSIAYPYFMSLSAPTVEALTCGAVSPDYYRAAHNAAAAKADAVVWKQRALEAEQQLVSANKSKARLQEQQSSAYARLRAAHSQLDLAHKLAEHAQRFLTIPISFGAGTAQMPVKPEDAWNMMTSLKNFLDSTKSAANKL